MADTYEDRMRWREDAARLAAGNVWNAEDHARGKAAFIAVHGQDAWDRASQAAMQIADRQARWGAWKFISSLGPVTQ